MCMYVYMAVVASLITEEAKRKREGGNTLTHETPATVTEIPAIPFFSFS